MVGVWGWADLKEEEAQDHEVTRYFLAGGAERAHEKKESDATAGKLGLNAAMPGVPVLQPGHPALAAVFGSFL